MSDRTRPRFDAATSSRERGGGRRDHFKRRRDDDTERRRGYENNHRQDERDRGDRRRPRSRSPSPRRHRTDIDQSVPFGHRSRAANKLQTPNVQTANDTNEMDAETAALLSSLVPPDAASEEAALMAAMGLPPNGFASSKGRHVAANERVGGVKVMSRRKFRQFMNKPKPPGSADGAAAPTSSD